LRPIPRTLAGSGDYLVQCLLGTFYLMTVPLLRVSLISTVAWSNHSSLGHKIIAFLSTALGTPADWISPWGNL